MTHRTTADLEAGLDTIRLSPSTDGTLAMIVRRPAVDAREVLETGELSKSEGLVGDSWKDRGSRRTEDGSPHPGMQLNVINARLIDLLAGSEDRWPLAGDQLYLDLDLSHGNLPAGTRLSIGDAVIEVTEQPHTGCQKFSQRFGIDALRFVNSETGKSLRLRGLNAKVVVEGTIRRNDVVRKLV
jgi:hypothetical protein